MMSRAASTFIFALLAIVALLGVISPISAIPAPGGYGGGHDDGDDSSQCNGQINCCNSVQSADSADVTSLLGPLGIVLDDLSVPVGLVCSPLSVLGLGGTSCNSQSVCCKDNSFNGVIAIGCSPFNVNLLNIP